MTTTAKITELIDKVDTSEIIRDQIAAILLVESTRQQELATIAAKDPRLWKLSVYSERSNPWADFEEAPEQLDVAPIVNVAFDSANYEQAASDVVERQKTSGLFHIDCYGYGVSAATDTGHNPGDAAAAVEAHRAYRLVRNILMSAHWAFLGLRKTVWRRWPESVQVFQPQIDGQRVQKIVGVRLSLRVDFNEFSPQVIGQPLELISATVKRNTDGRIYFVALYGDEDS